MFSIGLAYQEQAMRRTILASGFLTSLLGSFSLWHLAAITNMCMDNAPGAESIVAAAHRPVTDLSALQESDRWKYQVFLDYLKKNRVGVVIAGVIIDYEFVFNITSKTLVYIPTVLWGVHHFFRS